MKWLKVLWICLTVGFPLKMLSETMDAHLDSLCKEAIVKHDISSYAAICAYLSEIEQYPELILQYADSIHRLATAQKSPQGVMEYYSCRAEACFIAGNYEEGFQWKRKAFNLAEAECSDSRIASYASDMGYYYNVSAGYDSARFYLKKGMQAAERHSELSDLLHVLQTNFVSSFIYEGETDSALVYARLAEQRSALDKDTLMWLENLNQLGALYRRKKKMSEAISHFETALHLAEKQGNFRLATFIYGNIATAYCDWNRENDAIPFSEKAVEYAQKYGTLQMQGLFYVNLGIIQCKLPEKRKEGIVSLQRAIPLLEQVNNKRRLCEVYSCLTNVFIAEHLIDKAEKSLANLECLSNELKTDVEFYRYYGAKAALLKEQKRFAEALECYQRMEKMQLNGYRDAKDYECFFFMAECWEALGQEHSALQNMKNAYVLRDTAFQKEHAAQLANFSVRYQTQEKELEIARLREKELFRKSELLRTRLLASVVLVVLLMTVWVLLYLRQRQRARMAMLAQAASEKEQQFLTLQKDTEQRLTQKYIEGLESERGRVAAELHDDVCNSLLAISMNIGAVLGDGGNPEMTEQLHLLEKTRDRLRSMSHDLMPPAFNYATLDEMLYDYIFHLPLPAGTQVEYRSTDSVDWKLIPTDIVLSFYRIVQEALSNALKYANASLIIVELSWLDDTLSVKVQDDGDGFDISKKKKGIGLRTVEQRAESIGALVVLHSEPGKGTNINIEVILEKTYGRGSKGTVAGGR